MNNRKWEDAQGVVTNLDPEKKRRPYAERREKPVDAYDVLSASAKMIRMVLLAICVILFVACFWPEIFLYGRLLVMVLIMGALIAWAKYEMS